MTESVKLFIFSKPYTARVLIKFLQNIENKHGIEVVLLSELDVSSGVDIPVHTCDTIQQCVETCTQVLIVQDEVIPNSKIDLVVYWANLLNKHYTIVNELINNNSITTSYLTDKPTVLIVSYDTQTQISCCETVIHRILCDNAVNVLLKPSNELDSICKWIQQCNLSSDICDVYNNISINESNCDVVVQSLQYDSNKNILKCGQLDQLSPDVIIMSISRNPFDYHEIRNYFKYKYGYIIDVFVESELFEMISEDGNRDLIFDFSAFNKEETTLISLQDPSLRQLLSKVILPKISLPDGVSII